jgi:hypothetical protein
MPLFGHQFVTRAGRGLQKLGACRIVLDLLPQPMDELLEQLPVAGATVTPDMDQEAIGADRAAGTREEHLQQA